MRPRRRDTRRRQLLAEEDRPESRAERRLLEHLGPVLLDEVRPKVRLRASGVRNRGRGGFDFLTAGGKATPPRDEYYGAVREESREEIGNTVGLPHPGGNAREADVRHAACVGARERKWQPLLNGQRCGGNGTECGQDPERHPPEEHEEEQQARARTSHDRAGKKTPLAGPKRCLTHAFHGGRVGTGVGVTVSSGRGAETSGTTMTFSPGFW